MRHRPLYLFFFILIFGVVAFGQPKVAKPTPEPTRKLDPLSDVEKSLDYRKLLQSQPDYVADEKYFYWEGFGGFSIVNKVGRKGPRSFQDTGMIRVLADGERTVTMHPASKNFEEVKDGGKAVNNLSGLVTQLLSREGITFVPLGIMTVNGKYPAIQVEVKGKDAKRQVFLYFAKDLKYLVVASESIGPPPYRETRQLFNVSLEPADDLFQIPTGYSATPKHT